MKYPSEGEARVAAPEEQTIYEESKQEVEEEIQEERADELEEEEEPLIDEEDYDLLKEDDALSKKYNLTDEEIEKRIEYKKKFEEQREHYKELTSEMSRDPEYLSSLGGRIEKGESLLNSVKNFYEKMALVEVMNKGDAEFISDLKQRINAYRTRTSLAPDERGMLEKLEKQEMKIDAKIDKKLASGREKILNEYRKQYERRIERLEKFIKNITEQPQVKAALEQLDSQKKAEIEAARIKIEEDKRKEEEEKWKESTRLIKSVTDRNENAIKGIEDLVGERGFIEKLRPVLSGDESERKSLFVTAFNIIEKSIMEKSGTIDRGAAYFCPSIRWDYAGDLHTLEANVPFLETIASKEDDERASDARKIVENIMRARENNILLYALFSGTANIIFKKGGTEKFLNIFNRRKKMEQDGVIGIRTGKQKELRKRQERWESEVNEIVAQGGFRFEISLDEDIKTKNGEKYTIHIGNRISGIKLIPYKEELTGETRRERVHMRKGETMEEGWRVEAVGGYDAGINVGTIYKKDLSDLPQDIIKKEVRDRMKRWAKSQLSAVGEKE